MLLYLLEVSLPTTTLILIGAVDLQGPDLVVGSPILEELVRHALVTAGTLCGGRTVPEVVEAGLAEELATAGDLLGVSSNQTTRETGVPA